VIETSSDLIQWLELTPIFLPDGALKFIDEDAAAAVKRFYRLRIQ
jgi:hypothetical protein